MNKVKKKVSPRKTTPKPATIAKKVLSGKTISKAERSRLTPQLLATLALEGHLQLTMPERFRLPKSTLAQLAFSRAVPLSRRERDRFSPEVLAQLAMEGHVKLDANEYERVPYSYRMLFPERFATKRPTKKLGTKRAKAL